MEEVTAKGSRRWKEDDMWTWHQLCALALERRGDSHTGRKTAAGYYKGIYGKWPRYGRPFAPAEGEADPRVRRAVYESIKKWKRSKVAA